ncbi:MAG: glycosyltransferase family 4 protein [Chloroflexi bacterium]|nr:glycosyltransferase family 4 protein [Chloroflexota bacterium]
MRVCFIAGEYPPLVGGLGDYTWWLTRALKELGVESIVVTSTRAAGGHFPEAMPVVRHWGWPSWGQVVGVAKNWKADVVHLQYQAAAYAMHPATNLFPYWLRRHQIPTVTTFHDLRVPYLFPKAGPLRLWAIRLLAKGSRGVVVTNDRDWRTITAWGFGGDGTVARGPVACLVPIGSNIPSSPPPGFQRQAWRARWGIAPSDLVVGYFGLLNNSKGVDTLLLALAELLPSRPNLKLAMVGGGVGDSDPTNGEYQAQILGLVERLGLRLRLIWTGYAPPQEVSAHLLACDLCVLPFRDGASFSRGSLMSALVHGLPLVTTRPLGADHPLGTASLLPPLVHGENCLLVPPDAPHFLAESMALAMDSPELRERLGRGARVLAQAFSWPDIARKNLHLYEKVLERG